MKLNQCSFLLAAVFLLLGGCNSMSEGLAPTVPPQTLTVEGGKASVQSAAQRAFKRLDFRVTRSSMGNIEAVSAIHPNVTFGNSRQLTAKVTIRESESGKSELELWVTEEIASQSMGGTKKQPLRENGFFELYFAMLQQVLQEQAAEKLREKN